MPVASVDPGGVWGVLRVDGAAAPESTHTSPCAGDLGMGFRRTFARSKTLVGGLRRRFFDGFRRTFARSKMAASRRSPRRDLRFRRTFARSKNDNLPVLRFDQDRFQTNLREVEEARRERRRIPTRGFRRTFARSKLTKDALAENFQKRFQTNLRGVEASKHTLQAPRTPSFQTNPRGVEASPSSLSRRGRVSDEPSRGRNERHDKIRLENEVSRRTFVGLRASMSGYRIVVAGGTV